jgi:predicted transcriptional regulator
MDVSQLIRLRLGELRLDQKELANAAQVTEAYILQLRDGMKAPSASGRTDINERTAQSNTSPLK